jgi:hypothetical protein
VIQVSATEGGLAENFAGQTVELPYQVYPTKVAGPKSDGYWLPMYYAYWIGKSLATEDRDALEIYRNDQPNGKEQEGPQSGQVTPNNALVPGQLTTVLRYGNTYRFRVRMTDISGGGPRWMTSL